MANGAELREMLAKYRDQKFRKHTQKRLEGFEKSKAWRQTSEHWQTIQRKKIKNLEKAIITPYGEFSSKKDADAALKCKVQAKIKNFPHLYYYKEDGPGEIVYEKVYYTPHGYFNKMPSVIKMCADAGVETAKTAKCYYSWWAKMCRIYPDQYYVKTEPKREWNLEK